MHNVCSNRVPGNGCSTAGVTGQHPVLSSCNQSWFISREMGTLGSGSSSAPLPGTLWLFWPSGATSQHPGDLPVAQTSLAAHPGCAGGDRDGWHLLPRAHPAATPGSQAGVNPTSDLCSHLDTLNTNSNHTDGEYFTSSDHFLCDPASRALRSLPWQAGLS